MVRGFKVFKDGTPHRQFLKSKAFRAPPQIWRRPWVLEMSGRLLSLGSQDVKAAAEDGVAKSRAEAEARGEDSSDIRFRGIVTIAVAAARGFAGVKCDVIAEPTDSDAAHANFVADRDIKSELETMKGLAKLFRVVEPSDVDAFVTQAITRDTLKS